MPYMTNGKRDYKKEVRLYTSRPEVVKKREEQNKAHLRDERLGLVHKGDGNDVDHIRPLSHGGANTQGNTRVVKASINRSFSRNPDGSLKRNNGAERARHKGK